MKKVICSAVFSFVFLLSLVAQANATVAHNIKKGDSLYKIAKNYGTTVKDLKSANGLKSNLIMAGETITVPVSKPAANTARKNTGNTNWQSLDLLARLIQAEAGGEPFKGQVAVGAVIMNRLNDPRFPNTISGNIFKRGEFESVSNRQIWKQPSQSAYNAARQAIAGWDPTGGAKFFFNPAKVGAHSWVWSRHIIARIGNHVFAI